MVSRAIELNEQLQRVLARHDALISGRSTSTAIHLSVEETEEEEEAEQLFRRCVHLCWLGFFLNFGVPFLPLMGLIKMYTLNVFAAILGNSLLS